MDEILHHLEAMGNYPLVFTRDSSFQSFIGGAGILSIHSMVGFLLPKYGVASRSATLHPKPWSTMAIQGVSLFLLAILKASTVVDSFWPGYAMFLLESPKGRQSSNRSHMLQKGDSSSPIWGGNEETERFKSPMMKLLSLFPV